MVMQPTYSNWATKNVPGTFDSTKDWCIPLLSADLAVVFHVRLQQVAEAALIEHDNLVNPFPTDQADQPFNAFILPREYGDVDRSRMPVVRRSNLALTHFDFVRRLMLAVSNDIFLRPARRRGCPPLQHLSLSASTTRHGDAISVTEQSSATSIGDD
jgi:hypothetical protein